MDPQGEPRDRIRDPDPLDEEFGDPFALSNMPRRVAAYFCDCVLLAAALGIAHFAIHRFVFGGARPAFTHDGWMLEGYVLATISLPVWLYFAICESGPRQASLGKRLLGLRVTGLDGEHIGFRTAFFRTIIKLIPWECTHIALFAPVPVWDAPNETLMRPLFMFATFLVGSWFTTAILTSNQQGPHDLIMKTVVARSR